MKIRVCCDRCGCDVGQMEDGGNAAVTVRIQDPVILYRATPANKGYSIRSQKQRLSVKLCAKCADIVEQALLKEVQKGA